MNSSTLALGHPSYKSPLNKKRRFALSSNSDIQNSLISGQSGATFNSPLLIHIYGQEPSESDVQTQLFQVGMRVRKSVNEGYRTTLKQHGYLRSGSSSETTRLQPFAADLPDVRTPERRTRCNRKNKRSFTEDAEEDSDGPESSPMTPSMPYSDHKVQIPTDYFDINYDFDGMQEDISPTTMPEESPSQKRALRTRINGRTIAMPRSRRQKQGVLMQRRNLFGDDNPGEQQHHNERHQSRGTQWLGHERTLSERVFQLNDFEEADFLVSKEDIEMDCS